MTDQKWKIFLEVPDNLDESWTNIALIGGMADGVEDEYSLANNFKRVGDVLLRHGLKDFEAYQLLYPVLYNYRHAIELYLKTFVTPKKRTHDLSKLMDQFSEYIKENHGVEIPAWFK